MSKIKTTRGRLSQEQKDFLIKNNDMSVAKLQTAFRRKFKRKISVNNLTNFFKKHENVVERKSVDVMNEYAWSIGDEFVLITNDQDVEITIPLNVFCEDFVRTLSRQKQISERKKLEAKLEFWNNLS